MLQINSYIDHETWQRFICSVTVQNRQYFFASEDKITNNNNNKNERHNYQWCFNCTSHPHKLVYSFQHGMSQKHFTFAFLSFNI